MSVLTSSWGLRYGHIAAKDRYHFYWKCGHSVYDESIPAGECMFSYEYCPGCHRKLMDAEAEQRERVERERCVCCGSYVGGDLCEQP